MVVLADIIRRVYTASDALSSLQHRGASFYHLSDREYKVVVARVKYERDQFIALLGQEARKLISEEKHDETLSESAAPPSDAQEPKKRTRKKADAE